MRSVQLPFYAVAAAGSAAGILLIMPLPPAVPPAKKPLLQKVTAASSLLASYRPIQLLAPTEMVFVRRPQPRTSRPRLSFRLLALLLVKARANRCR